MASGKASTTKNLGHFEPELKSIGPRECLF